MRKLLLLTVLISISAQAQQVTLLSDEEYEVRCAKFSPRDPACGVSIRPRSAPLDCSENDFSPLHPFCTRVQTLADFSVRCDGFSPQPRGCEKL